MDDQNEKRPIKPVKEERPPSQWANALVKIAWTAAAFGLCLAAMLLFKPWVEVRTAERRETDVTYLLEQHKAVMNLELVRRTITGTVDKTFYRDYHVSLLGMEAPQYTLSAYAEIRCPVSYSYYVSLGDPWKIIWKNGVIRVEAPKIRVASPQVDISAMTERYEAPPIGFDREEIFEEMKRSLMPILIRMGNKQRQIDYVREDCRRQVGKFVRTWVMNDTPVDAVIVRFADDEPETDTDTHIIMRDEKELEIRTTLN
ncbi:hypothetical protein DENIS_4430 [Desulfonema ishimotonii]|uniref:DUF4230 domain-containing protein n=1 Tax=Desulfonema ishimotonii TaxID=45657 RepID=A0A401G2J5_9BACT|nr:hypothetical protein [Desulfonema ishimotonii]GBC63436.1 hypothetical protein DENIS_4430 [Desulfonema ishimotonii]